MSRSQQFVYTVNNPKVSLQEHFDATLKVLKPESLRC